MPRRPPGGIELSEAVDPRNDVPFRPTAVVRLRQVELRVAEGREVDGQERKGRPTPGSAKSFDTHTPDRAAQRPSTSRSSSSAQRNAAPVGAVSEETTNGAGSATTRQATTTAARLHTPDDRSEEPEQLRRNHHDDERGRQHCLLEIKVVGRASQTSRPIARAHATCVASKRNVVESKAMNGPPRRRTRPPSTRATAATDSAVRPAWPP